MKFFLFIILIISLTLLNFWKSLHLSLAGDDWAALYYYHKLFDGFWSYFQLSRYLGMYDFSFILMGTIEKFFGFNPFPYYFFSMVIRIATTLSFYPAVLSLTKDKRAAYLACILFVFAFGGIESTNWVFNMATYVSLGFFNLFLWQYFKNINKQNLKVILLESFFLFFSFYAAPNRMAPVLIIVALLEIASFFIPSFTKNAFWGKIINRSLRIGLFLGPIILFNLTTASQWDKGYATMIPRLTLDNFNPIFYFFSNIGSALIPDRAVQPFLGHLTVPEIKELGFFVTKTFWVILSFVILIYFLSLSLFKKTLFLVISYSLISLYTLIFFLSLQGGQLNHFENLQTVLEALIGGYFLIVFSFYFIAAKNSYPYLSRAGLFSTFTSLLFLIASWLVFVGDYPSDHRYLLVPTAQVIIFVSVIIILLSRQKNKILGTVSTFIIIILVTVNFLSVQSYFNQYLKQGRKADYAEKLLAQIHDEKYQYNDKPLVFLFISDDPIKLYNSITFGFPYHMMLMDKRFGLDIQKAPFVVDNFDSLVDVVSSENSKELKRYGYKPVKIPLENVYFFTFQNGVLANVTPQGRDALKMKLPL